MATKPTTFNILMFPWLAHGHIFPYLELAKNLLQRKNLHIYFCSTYINFSSIQAFIDQNSLHNSIQLVQLNLQPSPDLPPHYHTTKNLPSSLTVTLLKALQTTNTSFSEIVASLRPELVIYDVFMPWAAKIASSQGIPAVYFSIFGAAPLSYVHHQYTFKKKVDFPIHFEDRELTSLDFLFEYLYSNIHDVDQDYLFGCFKQSSDVVLIKTSKVIEEKYMEYLSSLSGKKLVPVGPLVSDYSNNKDTVEKPEIIRWLDDKKRHSTMFVSFGSEYFLSGAEIGEIARGLEICNNVNFIWIVRFPVGHDAGNFLEESLPEGFVERTKDRGMVVTGWAPQAEILSHPSVGGFVSHCGWSSVTESLYFGVPVVAMPMKLDQPINGWMLSEIGGGVEVWRNGEDEVYKGEEIAKGIREVFGEESGRRLRRRARELSVGMKMEKDGVLDDVSEELWRLCLEKKK
ncbi:hypothetical protein CASFOL_029687 [Castilleja foliolosa]|uniref:Glycosyltransferase n=1 Tax=Castilleja foliolosa TaxID=1961234 RepID=A0ABD3C8L0_9LAMI